MTNSDWKEMTQSEWFIGYGTEELLNLMEENPSSPKDEIRWLNEVAWALERIHGPTFSPHHTERIFHEEVESTWVDFWNGKDEWIHALTQEAKKFPIWMVEDVLLDPDQGWAGASIW